MTDRVDKDAAKASGQLPTPVSDVERMAAILESISAYMEQYHNGWVRFVGYEAGVLRVELGGACVGCALSTTTLHGWVEGTLRPFFPDLKRVESVT